ncbi:sensor histidine kinase [Lentzea rhizosphaerae]|uniref:Oxygen sensor histidine kinase NreB n=1 Tax=Lentzea rhizosphaerae TaxID=2041025 RepID=A0ABV8C0S2_9PSEU
MSVATNAAVSRRWQLGASVLLHGLFFVVITVAAVDLLSIGDPLCPQVISIMVALSTAYVTGLARWDRLGRWRPVWVAALLVAWLALVVLAPRVHYLVAWCAVPLACLVLQALRPVAAQLTLTGISAVLVFTLQAPQSDPMGVLLPIGAVWAAAVMYRRQQRLLDELHRTRDELAAQQRAAGALAERSRIARDLHDTLTQELAASRTLLQAADREWERSPDQARERVRTVARYLGDNLIEARRMIVDLTPAALDADDLSEALAELCARARSYDPATEIRCATAGAPVPLPPNTTSDLLRVVQGALANARDHAKAHHVTVALRYDGHEVAVEVRDDGVGFTPGATVTSSQRGFGLNSMRDRVRAHGGEFDVTSAPGRGTVIHARVPVVHAEPVTTG